MTHTGSTDDDPFAKLLQFSVLPVAKVLLMCFLGFLMATSYVGILTAENRRILSKLVFTLFLPCLIFTQLGAAVTAEKLFLWWFIPMNVFLGAVVGCIIGYIVAWIIRPPPKFFNFTVIMIGIGNIGNIPLVLIGAICREETNPFGVPSVCNESGVAYISFGQWVGAMIVYTYVYGMLAPPAEAVADVDGKQEAASKAATEPAVVPSSLSNSAGPNETEDFHLLSDQHSDEAQGEGWWAVVNQQMKQLGSHSYAALKSLRVFDILQPPVLSSILALTLGSWPTGKAIFFNPSSPIFFLQDSLNILGGAMIPCIMLVLGGNLIKGPGSSELGVRTTVAITATRLLLVPAAGMLVVQTAKRLHFFPSDDLMFNFVLLLQHTMPTSILAGAVATLRGHGEKEASAILFWEHIFAIATMSMWLTVYLSFLK